MPLRSRPLFLVPSLMRQLPATGAVMFDIGDAGADDGTATPACAAANALLDQLEPVIVEANLAGYEITVIAAASGSGTSPCLVISVETFLVEATSTTWDAVVTDVPVAWGTNTNSVRAALGLRFEPRLAMRDAVDDGSSAASHYAIGFTTPPGWLGSVDPSSGGWLVATSTAPVSLPEDVTTIAGRPGNSGTAATTLVNAIRGAAAVQWDAHGRQPTQLLHCALAPLFDTSTWRCPAGDVGAKEVARILDDGVWVSASGSVPSYTELAGLTLSELLDRNRRPVQRTLDDIRSALRSELVRRHLIDPTTLEGSFLREGELGPRFNELYSAVETIGTSLLATDLFRMLELGVMSLDRRVPEEEMLPALVEREWTEPIVTGFYDSVGTITGIPIEDLVDDSGALGWFSTVAAESAVVSINQAGDHIEAYWHEREFDPDGSRPVTVISWYGGGERNRAASGLVYDMVWSSERQGEPAVTGTYTFTVVGGVLQVVADWGPTMTFRRRPQPRAIFQPGETTPEEPRSDWVRPFWSDAEIDALPTDIRVRVRDAERHSLHPSEVMLLDAIVGRLAADLDAIPSTGQSSGARVAMCENLGTAFAYFARNGANLSELTPTARQFVLAGLLSMEGPDRTYLHALAESHAELFCDNITACLGMPQQNLVWLAADHEYRYKIHTRMTSVKSLKDIGMDAIADGVLKQLATKGVVLFFKIKGALKVGPTPQYDEIEAEFQKVKPYHNDDWPGTEDDPLSVFFDGILYGGGVAAGAGLVVSAETEWDGINAMGDPWSPADFVAGPFVSVSQYWGGSVFGLEILLEAPVNWAREKLGWGPARVSDERSYTQFMGSAEKTDIWDISRDYVNSLGLHSEFGAGVTFGQLWPKGEEPDPSVFGPIDGGPTISAAVSFDVGRSELTAAGKALLRDAAAARLHELASPATALEVVGHASFGDARPLYNLTLSQRRAANVVRCLQALLGPLYAVRPEQTLILGVGDQQAEEDGGPADSWRRVDVFINGNHAIQFRVAAP